MALVLGTNCGFVTEAPTADPTGASNDFWVDTRALAFKVTSPEGATKVTEIGWWCDTATQEADFDVGIYDHNSGDGNPEARIGVSADNAKGTTAGWKKATGLNIAITEDTIYWIAVQCDDTSTTTKTDGTNTVGQEWDAKTSMTALPNPWGSTSFGQASLLAIYAVYETGAAPTGTTTQIRMSGDGLTWTVNEQ